MTDLAAILQSIETAAEAEGLPSLAKRSGVPYTTLIDWQRAGWRPRTIQKLERLAKAVSPASANDDAPSSEAA